MLTRRTLLGLLPLPWSLAPSRPAPVSDPVAEAALAVGEEWARLDAVPPLFAGMRARPGVRLTPAVLDRFEREQLDYQLGFVEAAERRLLGLLGGRPGVAIKAGGKVYGGGRRVRPEWVAVLTPAGEGPR